ncbi:MAG: PqqD family protein [Acidobacteria bacterium]|nr:PqqD family protein [Acidobacteriota bacterium]
MNIDFTSRVIQSPETLINVIEGESVLLNLNNESYYGLDEVGTRMWELLTTSESIQAAYDQLLDEYEVEAETLRRDMQNLISKLFDQGLLEISVEQSS